jgi:hypothetical protein
MARANENARKLAPIIKAIQAQGITSLNGIAAALNGRRVPTPRGGGKQMGGHSGAAAVEAVGEGLTRAPIDHRHRGVYGAGAEPFWRD